MADTHFLIKKAETGGKTITNIKKLGEAEQVSELARMVGSAADGESAAQHAEALKKWAKGVKG
jgi:DNA repair ATPase RecN